MHQLQAWLAELPTHLPMLRSLLRPAAGPPRRGSTGRAHAPLPVDLRVLDLLGPGQPLPPDDPYGDQDGHVPAGALRYGWARYIASEFPAVRRDRYGTVHIERCEEPLVRGGATVAAWCAWLSAYAPYALTQPWGSELYRQLEDLLRRVRRMVGAVPQRTTKDAPCPSCAAFALVATDGEWWIRCEACGHEMAPEDYDEHRARVMPQLAAVAVHLLARASAAA
ncbi:hypothetical protein [Streptomyces sp. CC53]|uniref:hypothetical protein n=1 Tax=Streptomyces sp. CC53 TaxID=1906740 RepID=UPI00210973B1|nr:hypothetical protein [Streptomyces sp. CC53]